MQSTFPHTRSTPPITSPTQSACVIVLLLAGTLNAAVATSDDLTLAPESCWNGSDGSGRFTSGSASFNNLYNAEWDYWEGFAYSNCTDVNATGYTAQYNAIAGCGQGGTSNYVVAFVGWETIPTIAFDNPQVFTGLYVTNNCYAYYDMRDGSAFTKKFGGDTGDDSDWFLLTITGFDANDLPTGTVEFYLADFRFENNAQDYILDAWAFVDLTSLGTVKALQFTLSSSDSGDFGMNTPAYVCIDTILPQYAVATLEDFTLAPESCWNGSDDSGQFTSGSASFNNLYNAEWDYWEGFAYSNCTDVNATGYTAQYNAIAGCGQGGTSNYAVAFVGWETIPTITFDNPQAFTGLYVTNNCYAYYEMRDGSAFTKKFGGNTGNDSDWFKLTITGFDANDLPAGTVEFYLADFRFENSAQDYILDSWAFVDLTSLGTVKALQFTLSSSDSGDFGMNTPAYVCIDTVVSGVGEDEQTANPPAEPAMGDSPCQGK
ncbi:MAG: DUF4465 domain-containing protein [Solirubrobacterales bacterium]